jgi:Co/Zn/Cd efflux system component
MSACCSGGCAAEKPPVDAKYRRILWIALVLNAAMFFVEMIGGWRSGSASLLADAVDFFSDAANYGVSLFVLALTPVWRARTALAKGITMGVYGLAVLGVTAWHLVQGVVPRPEAMGVIGFLALAANGFVALLLYAYRNGDANMRSVWLCTRNDAIGNVAVMLAALGVFGTGAGWPDMLVAALMGILGLTAARAIIVHALEEIRHATGAAHKHAQPTGGAVVELKRR